MKSEYVKLSNSEKIYGQKSLLYSTLGTLSLLKSFNSFRELRNQGLELKIAFKNKIEEALISLEKLDKILPRAHHKPIEEHHKKKVEEKKIKIKWEPTLEEEIKEIKMKLEALKIEM